MKFRTIPLGFRDRLEVTSLMVCLSQLPLTLEFVCGGWHHAPSCMFKNPWPHRDNEGTRVTLEVPGDSTRRYVRAKYLTKR